MLALEVAPRAGNRFSPQVPEKCYAASPPDLALAACSRNPQANPRTKQPLKAVEGRRSMSSRCGQGR